MTNVAVRTESHVPTNRQAQAPVALPPVPKPVVLPEPPPAEAPKSNTVVSRPVVREAVGEDPNRFPRPVQSVLEAQIALARQGISSGSVDGLTGPQTRAALAAFQREQGLPATGELDQFTRQVLILDRPPTSKYMVNTNDLTRLTPLSPTWLGKSQQTRLDFESLLELLAETHGAHPNLIRRFNSGLDWSAVPAGTEVVVPDTSMAEFRAEAAFIRIYLHNRVLEAFDGQSNLVAHFPCSIAQKVEKRPAGELYITAIAPDPNYTFNPDVFPESAEAQRLGRKLVLPPGPNNPVGVAWVSLSKPGYGIHGTPTPEQVGRTESHGCFRLANWDATHLLKIVRTGMPVYVE